MNSSANHGEEEKIHSVSSVTTTTLESPPSCLEFSPVTPEYFVVGTYHLRMNGAGDTENVPKSDDEGSVAARQHRSGSLLIFRLQGDRLTLVRTIPLDCAVLDLHFSPHDPNTMAVAGSTGVIWLYRFNAQNLDNMNDYDYLKLCHTSILVTSLAWHPSPEKRTLIALSRSDGQVATFDYEDGSSDATLKSVQAHDLEAWTVAWSPSTRAEGTSVLYSGGDDSALCKDYPESWPPNSATGQKISQEQMLSFDRKTHSAGVTAILPIGSFGPGGEEVFLTGSYDEFVRILILPAGHRRSTVLAEKRLGGGVWRLKLLGTMSSAQDSELRGRVLASCMHAGARVLVVHRSKEGDWTIEILAKFEEHESMNYASDAQPRLNGDGTNMTTIVSSSFYDRKLCVWRINDN